MTRAHGELQAGLLRPEEDRLRGTTRLVYVGYMAPLVVSGHNAVCCSSCHRTSSRSQPIKRTATSATLSWSETQSSTDCAPERQSSKASPLDSSAPSYPKRRVMCRFGSLLTRHVVVLCLLLATLSTALAFPKCHSGAGSAREECQDEGGGTPSRSAGTADPITSLLALVEERKKLWAQSFSKRTGTTPAIHCASSLYGGTRADGTLFVDVQEAANCRSLCRALLHKYGRSCAEALDAYTCVLSSSSNDKLMPKEYRDHCTYTRPSVQQPDFESSDTNEKCLLFGMRAWLANKHRGDMSWDWFLENIPSSCQIKSVGSQASPLALRAQTDFSSSVAVTALKNARMTRFHVISRKLRRDSGQKAESVIVPGEYWSSLSASERVDWTVTNVFFAPSDDSELRALMQKVYDSSPGQAICLFRREEIEGERFGMIPGRSCPNSIGVLFVAALVEYPKPDFDAEASGFDLCVARRAFQGRRVEGEVIVNPLQLRTRVTIGSPCGVASGFDDSMWEVVFYASLYPQARGIEGIPSGGDCPWKGSFQLNSKCFLRPKTDDASFHLDFFSANEACRGLAEGSGLAAEAAGLASIGSDRELKFIGAILPDGGESWVGLYQPEQVSLVSTGKSDKYRVEEAECPAESLLSADGQGSRLSIIKSRCQAARRWPLWRSIVAHNSDTGWDAFFCNSQPQTRDLGKFADCATINTQVTGVPCLKARSCDVRHPIVCSLRLWTDHRLLSSAAQGVSELPTLTCRHGDDCWLELASLGAGRTAYNIHTSNDSAKITGFFALMLFCGTGPIVGGPWPLARRTNIGNDSDLKDLEAGVYEVCLCSQVLVDETFVSCSGGKDFRFLRGFLRLTQEGDDWVVPGLPEVTLKPLSGAANEGASLFLSPQPNEISSGVVYCSVDSTRRTDSTCRLTIRSSGSSERRVKLSFVPISKSMEGEAEAVCSSPGVTMSADVKGLTELVAPSFVPSSIKYAICADGSFIGNLIIAGLNLILPDKQVNNPYIEVTVYGYYSDIDAADAVLVVVEAQRERDTSCSADLASSLTGLNRYKGDYNDADGLLYFRFPAPLGRMKMCLLNPHTLQYPTAVSLGQAPLASIPEKILAADARCSFPPSGNCGFVLSPDPATESLPGYPFFPKTMTIKLLKGTVTCPASPDDPRFDSFSGDPEDSEALLSANAVTMTQTYVDSEMVEFTLEGGMRRWLAEAGIASICMTHVGLSSTNSTCNQLATCTAFLGYMRWTGPVQSKPHTLYICDEETECVVDVYGKHMNFLSMRFSRLAALDACGKLTGEGTLRVVGTFEGVNLSKLSDSTSSFRQLSVSDFEEESMVELMSGSSMDENRTSFLFKSTTTHGSLELCWNPSSGSGHNLLDHTISVGRVLLRSRNSLESIEVIPGATQQQEAKSLVIAVETSLDRSGVFGSTKLYFKRAPGDNSAVDKCDYQRDVETDAITTIISVSVVSEAADDRRLAYFVARFPTEKTSMCLVQFLAPMSDDLNQTVYLGRLPGLMLPSGDVEIICGLDDSIACEGRITVVPIPASDNQGSPLPLTSSIPSNLEAVALPNTSCPSDPSDIKVAVSTEEELFGERIVGEFTDDYINVTLDRTSSLLAYRGQSVLCLVDTDCKEPKEGNCVSTLGTAYWIGPPLTTRIDPICTALKAGRCEVTVPGYRMTSINYQLPRLGVTEACGDPAALHWAAGFEKEVEDNATLFAVPAMAKGKLKLCWNPHSLLATAGEGLGKLRIQTNKADFSQHLGTIQFLPFPVVRRRSISRKSAVSATVILEVDALLDREAASSIGRDVPLQGIWNVIIREPFTDGSVCSPNGVVVDLKQAADVVFKVAGIRDRQEGSAEETGSAFTNATVAVISFEVEPELEPYTYCWQTAIIGEGPRIIRQSWTPLISLPAPSKATLGGNPAHIATLLGFVPCMLGTADPAACNFSVVPETQADAALFPNGSPWILPSDSAVFLVPGVAECADVSSDTFGSATPADSSTFNPAEPLLLPSGSITEDYISYRLDTAKPWLSENGSATICWASRTLRGQAVKISQAFWLGPLYQRSPIKVTCAHSAVCTVWVHGKNLTKLDHSNSRVAILGRCGEAKGPGAARMRSTRAGSVSFITLASSDAPNLLTANNVEPVHFWGQPEKVFNARCKNGAFPEFLEAYWQDKRGICPQVDVTDLLNAHCNGAKRCPLIAVGSSTAYLNTAHNSGLRLVIPDDCDDVNFRRLLGTYRCVDERVLSVSTRQRVSLPSMPQLSSRGVNMDVKSADQSEATRIADQREATQITDQSLSYWVPREEPGLYEICWNPNIVPDLDPASFSESLGTLEMLPVIALVDEAVVCASQGVDSCTLEIVVESDSPVDDNRTVALVIAEQDGQDTCETMSWEEAQSAAIMPHQSSWNSLKSRNLLNYTTALPMASSKLCVVVLHNNFSEVGTVQYAGNTPGYSAPKEHTATENVCTADPVETCIVTLVPEDVSKYFALSNREPVEDESTPSFDAFDQLRPYLETSSTLYGLEGDMSCPSSPQDATYQEADEETDGSARRLLRLTTNLASFDFQVTSEQKRWLSEVIEVTLCWVVHSCTEDSLQNGTRPCTKKVGMLSWAGETSFTEPLPTVTCRLTDPCSFVVQGVNMSLMNHQRSRVAFLKECGGEEGPGIGDVTEFSSGYTRLRSSEQLGAASDEPIFLALKSRFAKQLNSPMKHRRSRIERLKRLEGVLSMVQSESRQTLAVPESLTVTARAPVEDTLSVCWNPLLEPTNNLGEFTMKIGTMIGYGIVATDAFCTSGSTCGIEFTHRGGSVLDPNSLEIRAFAGQCGDPSGIPEWLPNKGKLAAGGCKQHGSLKGKVYAFDSPLPFGDEKVETFRLCWCDELRTPACDVEDHSLLLGHLDIQTMRQQTWTCLKSLNEYCKFSLPETMSTEGSPSYVYAAELSGSSPASCTNPLLVLPTTEGDLEDGTLNLKFSYSDLHSVGLHDKAVALCWTRQENPSGGHVPVWDSSFVGNIVLFDLHNEKSLYAGIPPKISLSVTGLYSSQASKEGLPEPLRKLYLKDKNKCRSRKTNIAVPLVLDEVASLNGANYQLHFVASEAVKEVMEKDPTVVPQLSVCWCNSGASCGSRRAFNLEVTKLRFRGPVGGVTHECTQDTTCLMTIKDIPGTALDGFTPQLLIRGDCSDASGEAELPDEGIMSLRATTPHVSEAGDGDSIFEDHSYGFNSRILREHAFASVQKLHKRICYCIDSTDCSPERLVDIGQITMWDVWDTTFRVAIAQPIEVPFTIKYPLLQDGEQRVVRVTLGGYSENCELRTGENTCRIYLRNFPEETWSSEEPGTLEYYDYSIPRDALDDRPFPFVQLASLIPSGPWKNDYNFFCYNGGHCEVTIDVVNPRADDKVALLPRCGQEPPDTVGFSKAAEPVEDSANLLVFRWPDKLNLSNADTESGLELCWKAVENEAAVSDSIADYSSKFGTVSIRAIFPNQNRLCYVGAQCKAEDLRYQNLEGDNYIIVLQGGCGADGNEFDALPNGGIMSTESVSRSHFTLSLPGLLPIQGITSLTMCACTRSSCSLKDEFDWHVGDLTIKGPVSAAPLVSTFATEDIHFSWAGDFDDKFYVLLKDGSTCAASALDASENFQAFASVVDGEATWTGPLQGLGLLSVCICHDSVAGLSGPFAHPHEPRAFCEDAANYAAKVGQLFVNGPLLNDSPLLCHTGSICHVTIRWMAMDTEEVRESWAKSKVYAQAEDCSVFGTPLLSGGFFISDDKVGEQETSADPLFPVVYELRESVFMFNNPVDVGGGSYRLCWSPEGSNAGLLLGKFSVEGPVTANKIVHVAIGQKFDVEVEMSTIIPFEQAKKYRIRAYPYKGNALFENFDCTNQPETYDGPDTFNCGSIDGPPRHVKVEAGSGVSALVWEDVCVIVDDLATAATAGDMYAVCFCDGQGVGCETTDRFQMLVQAWALSGPKSFGKDVQPRYRAGSRFSLAVNGVDFQPGALIGFSPAYNVLTNARYTCRSEDKEVLGKFAGTVSQDGSTVTFANVYVPFTIPQGLLCWCPGDSCSDSSDFAMQLGRYSVAGPTFIVPRTVVGSYFTVQLIGPSLHRNDVITIRSSKDTCGEEDTENMDPDYIMEEGNRTLNSLGTVESFFTTDVNISGEKEMTWTSWGMRIKETEDRYLKICYCSAIIQESCGSPGSASVLAGLLEARGPSRGDVELVASEEHGEYLIVRGTNLSTQNLLRYFQYPGQDLPTAEEEAQLCSNRDQGGETTFPDAVNAAGTEQYFSVTVATGKKYVACWSFGEDSTSVASSMRRQNFAPSFLRIEELLRTRRNLATFEESPELASATDALNYEEDDSATEQPEAQTIRETEAKTAGLNAEKWYFVSIFLQTGFQQGIHNVVVGYEDTVVVNGVVNATDTYSALLGKSHQMHDCTEIFNDSSLQSEIGITTFAVTESRVVLVTEAATQVGWHKLCIKNQTISEIFTAGTVEVTPYFFKTGADMYDTRRTFVLPCVTALKNASGGQAWTKPQVWLPDGTGLWTANVADGEPGTSRQYSTLKVTWPPEDNFKEFPQLRNVLACDTTKDQTVLVLGATHMLVIHPDSSGREPVLINHGVPYPADITSASDQVFITSFDSHLITSFSLQEPKKIIFYEPTDPTLLSAGGIQAIQNIDGGETAIFVADTVGGMIGRLLISPDDLSDTANGGKISRKWTAVFGKQKSDFRNAHGVNRPFCVGEFVTNYSTQEKMNPLLLVGELISDRVTFLSLDGNNLSFYRQINLGVTKFITGLRVVDDVMLLTSKQWSVEQELGKAEVLFVTFSQLIDNVYFTYPDFTKQLQAGLRYRFLPLVTGQEIQFFKEDAVAGDPLESMGFTLDSKTGEIQGTLTATVTSRVVIVGGDLLGSYTWSFEFEAGCQSGEYFNESSNRCEPCPLGTFRDEETELQKCWDYKAFSTTLQTGSTNLSQCACVEGYEIGHLGTCQPCPAGTYKAIVADANCTGRCPQHMSSEKTGADSLEALNCQCDPGFYLADDDCQSCQVGSYCAGNLSPPVQCPAFQTTSGPASSSSKDCVCAAGYYRRGEECVPCGLLTYKPLIGDQACTACPQPAASAASSQLILASSSPDSAMFSSKKGATQQSECEICASGYYFDSVSVGGCVPCKKDHYCPGFQLGILACKNNSVTVGLGAESVFQCGCPRGYGKAANRNPLDLTLTCTPCPYNYFQHVEGADSECIPCPTNSMTKTTMSKSITSCVAMPGFSALENLQALASKEEDFPTGDSASTSFLDALELVREVEKAYEMLSEEDMLAISVFCKEGDNVAKYDMAEFVTTMYASSLAECQEACLKNVYCTSFSFTKEDLYPTHTNSIMNYTGIYPYDFWPCRLYIFGAGAAADAQDWTDIWKGTEVEPGKAVGCVVGRVTEELAWQRLRYIECPPNAYCPGDKDANIIECKDYSVTLGPRAYSSEHCLCVPGREPVGHACEQCKLGYYKNTTENVACTECPQFFTTSITASTSAYECACQPGMYMAPAGTAEAADVGADAPDEASGNELEPAAVETMAQARSLRELGKHGKLPSAPPVGVSMAELLQLPWLEDESREQLEKVVELGVCMPCDKGMFCPGLWKDTPTNSTHMPPQQCIEGSSVPFSTVNADSVEKCLCLAGYAYGRSSDITSMSSDSYFTCSKCSPGTYKELQENAPCSGRCMKDAETFPGAVSKSQCFCQVGRYAVESDDSEGLFSCVECVSGGVCIGGLKENVIRAIEENPSYANIKMSDHTIPYPQKGWFATFKPLSEARWSPVTAASRVASQAENQGIFDTGAVQSPSSDTPSDDEFPEIEEALGGTDKPIAFLEEKYDRVPDIHACPIDYRCHGGPTNSCAEGATGYLCGKCESGYDVAHFGTICSKCDSIWVEVGGLFASRLVICIIVWIIAAVSCLAVQNPACIHPILIRIWISNFFLFFLFGFFPDNSASALAEWASTYRAVFAYPVFVFTRYPKIFCVMLQLGLPLDYRHSWYLQRHAREVHAGDVWAMRTVEKIQGTRCLGLFHYISPPNATFRQKLRRFFGDLVPAFMIVWFWNLPFLVIECTQLLGCVRISYKDEPSLIVLTALPEQSCSFSDPWFLAGLVIGAGGILVWGIGSVIVFCVWMLYTDNADNLESRFRYGFLSNGYEFQYRAWEMLLMARKLACACLLTLQLQMNASGTQEIFRNSINLLIATSCLILQLLIEPYDRRSHNLTNRVEFLGLLTNVVNCIIIQGSFSFSVFKWLGLFPIITCGLFHTYIFWSLFVEAGRMVLMRPHLARLPSPWRYFNLVTRSLARLYTRGNAKVYYNYITKEMVLEAAAKSRVFHLRRLIQRKKKNTDYRKINYENRTYFVSALTDSLSRLVICWCQFTIPGDWLDFTIRYSFCYCFWMRHRAASLREPLDLDEFDALRPSLFNEGYVEREDGDDDGFLGSETQCNEVEAEFLDMMVDDDVYDDSPITLMELYIAVQSMRYIPKGQLRRLHMWYRERMAAAAGSDIPNLRRENEELEAELQQLGDVLRSRFGATGEEEPSFSVLDFFFTVEMVHEAEEETLRIKKEIDREITNILNARAAHAVAERVHRELEKTEGEELEDILKSVEEDIAERQEKTKDRTEYLEPALRSGHRKVRTREKPAHAQAVSQEPASAEVPEQSARKRRRARLAAKKLASVNIAEERKRVRRPSAPLAETKAEEKVSLLPVAAAAGGGGRTLSRVGFSDNESQAVGRASRRRISLKRDELKTALRSPLESSGGRPSRRISLSVTAGQNEESDSGSQSGTTRRTLKAAGSQKAAEAALSSETQVSPKRTLRSASLQRFSDLPSPPETQSSFGDQASRRIAPLRGDSTAFLRERRTLSPLGPTAGRPETQLPDSSSMDAEPSQKRTLGRFVQKEESEQDKS
ncbi:hypothetical protein Esti_004069 [Eimeria stiedai]